MQVAVSYPVLPSDNPDLIEAKERQALLEMFNYLIVNNLIKRTEGHDFINGGFVKKVNLILTLADETATIEVKAASVVEEIEPITKGCISCAN